MNNNTLIIGKSGIFVNHLVKNPNHIYRPIIVSTNMELDEFIAVVKGYLQNNRIEYVFYNSTLPKYDLSDRESSLLIDKTVTYFTILINLINKYSFKSRIILLSTAAFNRHSRLSSAYLSAKRAAEFILLNSKLKNYTILKLYNVYGVGGNLVVDNLKFKFCSEIPKVKIYGNPAVYRNFTHIYDLFDFLLNYSFVSGINETIYISGPDEMTIGELAELFSYEYDKPYYFEGGDESKIEHLAPSFDLQCVKHIKVGKEGSLKQYIMSNND
jgi:nucleoside-diphosphate-sugar epimerase